MTHDISQTKISQHYLMIMVFCQAVGMLQLRWIYNISLSLILLPPVCGVLEAQKKFCNIVKQKPCLLKLIYVYCFSLERHSFQETRKKQREKSAIHGLTPQIAARARVELIRSEEAGVSANTLLCGLQDP